MTALRTTLVALEIAAVQQRPEDPQAAILLRLAGTVAVQRALIESLQRELAEVRPWPLWRCGSRRAPLVGCRMALTCVRR